MAFQGDGRGKGGRRPEDCERALESRVGRAEGGLSRLMQYLTDIKTNSLGYTIKALRNNRQWLQFRTVGPGLCDFLFFLFVFIRSRA
jgi:hypothetical protein